MTAPTDDEILAFAKKAIRYAGEASEVLQTVQPDEHGDVGVMGLMFLAIVYARDGGLSPADVFAKAEALVDAYERADRTAKGLHS
jgi:hypothetical protein